MPDERFRTCAYRVLRYAPNLVRDEWVNIGILLHDPQANHMRVRLIEETSEFARLRRLHPTADVNLLRALAGEFETQIAEHKADPGGYIAQLDETLSNVLQLSPQRAVLAEDFDVELDRLYRDHVAPLRHRGRTPAEVESSRIGIRTRANDGFRRARILERMERGVSVVEFTYPGDPLKLDFAYRRNGTRGFVHALAIARGPGQARELAFTAERIRAKLEQSEFVAITEIAPRPDNERDQFIVRLLAEQEFRLIPIAQVDRFAEELRPTLH